MGKSSNQPDMTDIAPMMVALEGLHSGHVEVSILPDGIGSPITVLLQCSMKFDLLPGSSLPSTVTVACKWPNKHGRTFLGELFNELWQLDWAISQAYNQLPLQGT